MPCPGNYGDAAQGQHNAGHRKDTAAAGGQFQKLAVNERRNHRAHHQRYADRHTDAERHSKVAHRESVTHVAYAPHAAEEEGAQENGVVNFRIELPEAGQ